MAKFVRMEKVSHLRIFTHVINIRKFMISCCVGVNDGVNQAIKRVLVACTQADEFIDLDDLVTRLCFMDNSIVTASVHAQLLGFAQHSE